MKMEFDKEDIEKIRRIARKEIIRVLAKAYGEMEKIVEQDEIKEIEMR